MLDTTTIESIINNRVTEIKITGLRNNEIVQLCNLLERNDSVRTLILKGDNYSFFSRNRFADKGAAALAKLIKQKNIISLQLDNNSISAKGAKLIAESLNQSNLSVLSLADNNIGNEGAIAIFNILKTNNKLTFLNLNQNAINEYATSALSEMLKVNNILTSLLISGKYIDNHSIFYPRHETDMTVGDEGAGTIADALKINSKIKFFDLSCNEVGNKGIKSISEMLNVNNTIETLFLTFNYIGDKELEYLSDSLKQHSSIKYLDLTTRNTLLSPHMTDNGLKLVSNMLKVNRVLETLSINNCWVTNNGIASLADCLNKNSSLSSISLLNSDSLIAKPQITRASAEAILSSVMHNKAIQKIRINYSEDSTDLVSKINQSLQSNFHKTALDLKIQSSIKKDSRKELNQLLNDNFELEKSFTFKGMHLLHLACVSGSTEVIDLLIERGFDPNQLDDNGLTAFGYLVQNRLFNLADKLKKIELINAFCGGGDTLLHYLIMNGSIESVSYLLQNRAVLDQRNNSGLTPLNLAVKLNKSIELVKLLIQAKAAVNIADYDNNTPLHYSAKNNRQDISILLLQYGSNPTIVNSDNKSAHELTTNKELQKLICEHKINFLKKYSTSQSSDIEQKFDTLLHGVKELNNNVLQKITTELLNEQPGYFQKTFGDAGNLYKYHAHLLSIKGTKYINQNYSNVNLEGFTPKVYLPLRIKVFLQIYFMLQNVGLNNLLGYANSLTNQNQEFSELIKNRETEHILKLILKQEIFSDIKTYTAHNIYNKYINDIDGVCLIRNHLFEQINKLQENESLTYGTGFIGHSIQVNFLNTKNHIVVRVDNLGACNELHSERKLKLSAETIKPYLIGVFPLKIFQTKDFCIATYLENIVKAKTLSTTTDRKLIYSFIYNKDDICHLQNLSNQIMVNEITAALPYMRVQTVGNCRVKNRQPELRIKCLRFFANQEEAKSCYNFIRILEGNIVHARLKNKSSKSQKLFSAAENKNLFWQNCQKYISVGVGVSVVTAAALLMLNSSTEKMGPTI